MTGLTQSHRHTHTEEYKHATALTNIGGFLTVVIIIHLSFELPQHCFPASQEIDKGASRKHVAFHAQIWYWTSKRTNKILQASCGVGQ